MTTQNLKQFELSAPNTCHNCGDGPFTTVYAANKDAAKAGKGVCAQCAGLDASDEKKKLEPKEAE